MGVLVFILLGIAGILANANNWFAVPQLCINICFGIGGFLFLIQLFVARKVNKEFKHFDKF